MSNMKLIEKHSKLEPFIFITEKLVLAAPVVNIMVVIFFIKFNDAYRIDILENRSITESLTNENAQIQNDQNQTTFTETDKRQNNLVLEYNSAVTDHADNHFKTQSLKCLPERSNSKNIAHPLINNPIIMRNNSQNIIESIDDVKFHPQTEVRGENIAINFTFSPLYRDKKIVSSNNVKLGSTLKRKEEISVVKQMINSKKPICKVLKYLKSKPGTIPYSTNISHNGSLQNRYSQLVKNKTQDLEATERNQTAFNSLTRLQEGTISPLLQLNESRTFCYNSMKGCNKDVNSEMADLRSTQEKVINSGDILNGSNKPSSTINNIIRKIREIETMGNYSLCKEKLQNNSWKYNTHSLSTRNGSSKIYRVMPRKMLVQFSRMLISNSSPKTALKFQKNITKKVKKLKIIGSKSHISYKPFYTGHDSPIIKRNIELGKIVKKSLARKNVPISLKDVKYKYYGNANKQRELYIKKAITATFTNMSRKLKKLHKKPEFKNYKILFSTQKPKLLEYSISTSVLNEALLFRKSFRDDLMKKQNPIDDDFMDDFNKLFVAEHSNNQMSVKPVSGRSNAFSIQPGVINKKKVFGKTDDLFLTMGRELLNKYVYERKGTTKRANFRLREVEIPKGYRNIFGLDEDDDEGYQEWYDLTRNHFYDVNNNNYSRWYAYRYRGEEKYYTWKSEWMNKVNNVVVVNFPTTGEARRMRLVTEATIHPPIAPIPILKHQCYMDHAVVFALFTLGGTGLLFLSCCCYATVNVIKKRNENRKKYEYLTRITRAEKRKKNYTGLK